MIRACLLALCALGLSIPAGFAQAADAGSSDNSLPGDVSGLKMDIITLNRDITQLENELLFPSSQAAVLVSVDAGSNVRLVDINLSLDDKNIGYHFYTDTESAALRKGGIQRLYTGNISSGSHTLRAVVNGYDIQGKAFQRTISLPFSKSAQRKVIELHANDDASRTQSEFRFKEWESQ
jgi:hypothetical protein